MFAKQTCAHCGAEIGITQQIKMEDGNFVCRKCASDVMKPFKPVQERNIKRFKEHLVQEQQGRELWEKLFVPRLKAADKSKRLQRTGYGKIYLAEDIGLLAVREKHGGFIIWGGTWFYTVYRYADLYEYKYEPAYVKDNDGKEKTVHYAHFKFWDTPGMDDFKLDIGSKSSFESMEKYFDKSFGIHRTLGNSISNFKKDISAIKNVASGLKTAFSGDTNDDEKGAAAEAVSEEVKNRLYGDRTAWAAKADAAINSIKN